MRLPHIELQRVVGIGFFFRWKALSFDQLSGTFHVVLTTIYTHS